MPWDCKACGAQAEDHDTTCPSCQTSKTSWTLVAEKTRTFAVSTRRFQTLLGAGATPIPEQTDGLTLEPTGRAPVLKKDVLRALAEAGQRPAVEQVLVIRLFPKKHPDLTTTVEVLFETDEVAEHALPVERPADLASDGHVDVKLVCVHGPGAVEDPGWSDIHVLDVGEETEQGHAPSIEVHALKKKAKRLTLGAGEWFLSVACYDASGFVPIGDLAFSFQGASCRLDAEGRFERQGVALGEHALAFSGGTVYAPAVHDPRVQCALRLPFHEVSQEELQAYFDQEWDDPDDDLDAFGAFEEEDEDDDEDPVEEDHEEECCAADPEEEPEDDDDTGEYVISISCVDASGFVPAAGLSFTFAGETHQLDGDGLATVEDVSFGEHQLVFEGGTVWVPAVHDPRVVCAVRLPFHEVSEEERKAYLDAEWDDPDDGLDAFQAFEPEDDEDDEDEVEEDHEEECCTADPEEEPDDDDAAGEYVLSIACVDASGFVPAAGLSFSFAGESHQLDEDGQATVEDIAWGEHELTFEGGTVWVPAVHDSRVRCEVRLPFHEVSASELAGYLEGEWDKPSDPEAFQAFDLDEDAPDEDDDVADDPLEDDAGCGHPEDEDEEDPDLDELTDLLE